MIPKQTIQKAIEGGWQPQHPGTALRMVHENGFWLTDKVSVEDTYFVAKEKIALDPTFWQALGKALGWPEKVQLLAVAPEVFTWRWRASRFYDLILTGGDTEKFWAETLI